MKLLNIVSFWDIVDSSDFTKLDLNYNAKKKYNENDLQILAKHWDKLYDEFYEHRKNKSGSYLITKNFELAQMSLKLELLYDLESRVLLLINVDNSDFTGEKQIQDFITSRTYEAVSEFKRLYTKVRISVFNNLFEILTIIQSVIKSQTNIYEEKLGAKDNSIAKQKGTVYDIVAQMSKILGYRLDINTMSCMEFISHENLVNSMSNKK